MPWGSSRKVFSQSRLIVPNNAMSLNPSPPVNIEHRPMARISTSLCARLRFTRGSGICPKYSTKPRVFGTGGLMVQHDISPLVGGWTSVYIFLYHLGMKQTRKIQRLLERMAAIERMERGKVCPMAGRPHYNHQTWQDGRNVVRYVPAEEVASLQQAIDGYNRFRQLAEEYADEIIRRTREEHAKNKKPKRRSKVAQ